MLHLLRSKMSHIIVQSLEVCAGGGVLAINFLTDRIYQVNCVCLGVEVYTMYLHLRVLGAFLIQSRTFERYKLRFIRLFHMSNSFQI